MCLLPATVADDHSSLSTNDGSSDGIIIQHDDSRSTTPYPVTVASTTIENYGCYRNDTDASSELPSQQPCEATSYQVSPALLFKLHVR